MIIAPVCTNMYIIYIYYMYVIICLHLLQWQSCTRNLSFKLLQALFFQRHNIMIHLSFSTLLISLCRNHSILWAFSVWLIDTPLSSTCLSCITTRRMWSCLYFLQKHKLIVLSTLRLVKYCLLLLCETQHCFSWFLMECSSSSYPHTVSLF